MMDMRHSGDRQKAYMR
jgi:hypothetical protein